MSLRSTARAFPTILRIGFAEAVAYRAEMLVWVLATTMPLVSMALWTAVARGGPIGRFNEEGFVAYFLGAFIVRQLVGSWVAWQMNFEVRTGTLSMRLLRPLPPVVAWAVEHLAAIPMRVVVSIPVATILLITVGAKAVTHSPAMWAIWLASLVGGWAITFLAGVALGSLCFFMEQSLKLMDVYLAFFFVFSGYLIPIDLFPEAMRAALEWMPFRYQIGFPVEVMTGRYELAGALVMLAKQWAWVALLGLTGWGVWRAGLRRFAAYGG